MNIDSENVAEKEGETQSDIRCTSDCKPSCTFAWMLTDVNGHNSDATDSGRLRLGQLDRDEHGTYTCKATNTYDVIEKYITVTVYCKYVQDSLKFNII